MSVLKLWAIPKGVVERRDSDKERGYRSSHKPVMVLGVCEYPLTDSVPISERTAAYGMSEYDHMELSNFMSVMDDLWGDLPQLVPSGKFRLELDECYPGGVANYAVEVFDLDGKGQQLLSVRVLYELVRNLWPASRRNWSAGHVGSIH